MEIPELKIGDLRPKFPIIQGGMAIKVSMANLAAAVANEGGIGVIGGTAMTTDELEKEIKKAKKISDGIIGVNIMYAARDFKKLLESSIKAGIDVIISGAGFSRDMFAIGKKAGVPVVPIVSSLRLAKISEKLGADAIVVEGGNAGGHLGTDVDLLDFLEEIKEEINIPVIAAGDIVTPEDVGKMFARGMDGVQMGTRFLTSLEASVSDVFKKLCVKAGQEDVITIMSSVGFPGNAIKTSFSKLVKYGTPTAPESCNDCLKQCKKNFCIRDALLRAKEGDRERGIFFSGKGAWKVKEILSVKEIFTEIIDYLNKK